jgi:hypothetical protein
MFIPGFEIEMRSQAAQMIAGPMGVPMVLHWREVVRPEGYNPNDESSTAGTVVTPRSRAFRALFHQVETRLSGFQRFLEVQTGDVMIDYLEDLELAGKEDLRVEVRGVYYTQKTASSALLESWDCQMESGGMFKTLLLTPAG